jgi:CubicO group peptidase (beta-lactamase class C family)
VLGIFIVLALAGVYVAVWGRDPLRIASGSVARAVCAAAFVSNVDPDRLYAEEEAPLMRPFDVLLRYRIDREKREVRASFAGAFAAQAVYREGIGCLVVHGDVPEPAGLATQRNETTSAANVASTDAAIAAALDHAFAEPDPQHLRQTKAFVVMHEGNLIAERYADGYGPDTPIWAHSVTKSLTSALIGILVREGKVTLDTHPRVTDRQAANDPRRAITVDHLLRMTSGLPFDDTPDIVNPLTRMLFLERDMAGYAESLDLQNPPGKVWNYSNAGYEILSRMIRDAIGPSAVDVERFARRELFDPLGMHSAMLDCDATGTPVGASTAYASARDWARFGQLYLDDGVVDGRRVLPEGWVDYSRSQTLDTGYGAGFWTNRLDKGTVPVWDAPWGMPSLPRDMFYARGALGQYIVIIPSERLVVVRMGLGYGGVEGAISEIIAALHGSSGQVRPAR